MTNERVTPEQYAREVYGDHPAAPMLVAQIWYGSEEEQKRAKAALSALGLKPLGHVDESLERAKTRWRLRRLADGVRGAALALDRFGAAEFTGCLSTGLSKLDRRHRGGLSGGRMYLVGAPTGGGKTTWLQQLVNRASESGPVLFVSPEMTLESLVEREIVRESGCTDWARNPWGVDTTPAERATAEREHAAAASRILLENRPVFVLDQPDATMPEIERAAEAIEDLRAVVIDYAQQVAGDGPSDQRARYLQVGEVATRSVAMAMRLGIPVVVASQVNEVQAKDGQRKRYTFRESQILEHKAHAIMILDVTWDEDEAGDRCVKEAWVRCTKNRSGPCFNIRVNFDSHVYRLTDHHEIPTIGPDYRGGLWTPKVPED